jgi:hypothetical protein
MFRGKGVSQMTGGSAAPVNYTIATKDNHMKGSPLGVASHLLLPPLHMDWLNHFRLLSPKACGTFGCPRETTEVAIATPIRVLSRIHPRQTVVIP